MTAEISQFRDNYSKQIIEIQLTNTTGGALTVLGAELTSPLFAAPITWPAPRRRDRASAGTGEEPAGTAARAGLRRPGTTSGRAGSHVRRRGATHVVSLRLVSPDGAVPEPVAATAPAADPFGVLARNNAEMCLTRDAAAVAAIGWLRTLRSPRTGGPPSCVC